MRNKLLRRAVLIGFVAVNIGAEAVEAEGVPIAKHAIFRESGLIKGIPIANLAVQIDRCRSVYNIVHFLGCQLSSEAAARRDPVGIKAAATASARS